MQSAAAPSEGTTAEPQTGPDQQNVQPSTGNNDSLEAYNDTDPSALTDFREPLARHGTWVEDPTYGTVWLPSAAEVGPDFAPYQTAGRWALSDDGDWLWVSDYEWGHIPFHYGRWVWISGRGWAWIPGRVYAPAWVAWRVGDYGYIGWAPLPPTYYWSHGVAVSLWAMPPAAYVFCPTTYVFYPRVHTYVVRDVHIVRRIGAHSRVYRPSNPAVGVPRQAHVGANPRVGGASVASAASMGKANGRPLARAPWRGPSLAEARVPASAVPKSRAVHDSKALAYATRNSTAQVRGGAAFPHGLKAASRRDAVFAGQKDASLPDRAHRSDRPTLRVPAAQERFEPAARVVQPSREEARPATPSRVTPSRETAAPPTRHEPPRSTSARPLVPSGSVRATPSASRTPVFRQPARVAPSYSPRSAPSRPATPSVRSGSHRR